MTTFHSVRVHASQGEAVFWGRVRAERALLVAGWGLPSARLRVLKMPGMLGTVSARVCVCVAAKPRSVSIHVVVRPPSLHLRLTPSRPSSALTICKGKKERQEKPCFLRRKWTPIWAGHLLGWEKMTWLDLKLVFFLIFIFLQCWPD